MLIGITRQFQALRPTIIWIYLPTLAVLGVVGALALITGRRVWYFTNDPFTLGHLPFYAGVLSSLANVLWGAGATVCFFSAMVLGKRGEDGIGKTEDGSNYQKLGPRPSNPRPYTLPPGPKTLPREREEKADVALGPSEWRWFLLASGVLTSLFLFDDLFQFHRILYIKYLPLSAETVFAIYGLAALVYLVYFRKEIAKTEYLLLGVALALFAAAVVFDTVSLLSRGRTAFSDALKFLGIVTWVAYFARTGRQTLRGE